MRDTATSIETQAEKEIGHPEFLDPAVQLALDRLTGRGRSRLFAAKATEGVVYDVVLPGETAHLTFALENSGRIPWTAAEVQLISGDGNPKGAPRALPLSKNVALGGTASWDINLKVTGAPGVRLVNYQMAANDEPFGDVVTGYVVLLPEQMKDAEKRIRQQIDEWQQQGEQAAEELMKRIMAELEREMQKQAMNFLDQLQSQCSSSLLIGVAVVLAGWHGRRRLRR